MRSQTTKIDIQKFISTGIGKKRQKSKNYLYSKQSLFMLFKVKKNGYKIYSYFFFGFFD